MSCAILCLVAAFALTAAQTPPPALAELAPNPEKNIDEAPREQSSEAGRPDGGGGPDGGLSTTTTAPPGPDQDLEGVAATTTTPQFSPRRRRCVGDPPRQTDDPQSPPCVAYWVGDNGGATSKGVTRDTIRIAVPSEEEKSVALLQAHFNARYELYGRKLVLVPTGAGNDCTALKAAAVGIDEAKMFGSLSLNHNYERCFFDELVRRQLVGVTAQPVYTEDELAARAPYLWTYPMSNERLFSSVGTWICARLWGGPARFADGTDGSVPPQAMASKRRTLGMIVQTDGGGAEVDERPLRTALARCGADIAQTFRYQADGAQNNDASTAASAIITLRNAGVTSVICLCIGTVLGSAATSQSWYPEWLVSTYSLNDYNAFFKVFWPDDQQRANVLGLTAQPRQVRYADTPVVQAFQDADGSYNPNASADGVYMLNRNRLYHQLLLFVSGIQMAGPNLTPATFQAGLQRTAFPNPDHKIQAGHVGFATPKDHSMTEDLADFWWSATARSPYQDEGVGTICYTDGGRRRTAATGWPPGDAEFFTAACDSGA